MSGLNRHSRKLLTVAGLALLIIVLAVPGVRAFEGRGGDVVVIEADEVIEDDLYVGAGEFTLDGTVKGDVVVVGGTLTVNGTVEGDLIAAGQSVIVNGTVEDDARIAGYALTIAKEVSDDVIAAGFSLESKSGANIGGDLIYAGYQAVLAGDIGGDADVGGGAVKLAGAIGGNADIDVGGSEPGQGLPPGFPFVPMLPPVPSVPPSLTVDEGASIGGDLNYTANVRPDVPSGAVAGQTDFNQYVEEGKEEPTRRPAVAAGMWSLRQVRRLLTFLLIGAAMMWLAPDWTRKIAKNVETKPLPSLGWGAVAILAFGAAMFALVMATILLAVIFGVVTLGELAGRFAVLGGLLTGSVGFSFSLLWRYVTAIVISLLLGQLIFRLFNSPAEQNRWWPLVVGVVILVIVTAIPVLGWIARLATVLLGLGAVWIWGLELLRSRQAASVAAEA